MKIITFNVNGIRAAARRGFYNWLEKQQASFVCLQEIKAQLANHQADALYYPADYYCEYYDAHKKGYSGVAIYARHKPLRIIKGLNFAYCDTEGRYLQFDYSKISIISVYLPSGTSGDIRQQVKYDFLQHFAAHLAKLKQAGRELIICGDYNIAHTALDLKNWRANQKHSGFLPAERHWMDKLFGDMGFIDAFRLVNQQPDQYTWWSMRSKTARAKNVGWRIDYQVITPKLKDYVQTVKICSELVCSDHAPLMIEYTGNWDD